MSNIKTNIIKNNVIVNGTAGNKILALIENMILYRKRMDSLNNDSYSFHHIASFWYRIRDQLIKNYNG